MRIALTTALIMVATLALADEPSAPESKTEATTEAAPDSSAAQPAATETTAKAEPAEKPFKPPAGYKPKRLNGEQVWCQKMVILGSKFAKEDCRTEAQLREIVRSRASMREDLGRGRACTGGGCNAN